MKYYKAFIRVIKQFEYHNSTEHFDAHNVIREPYIVASSKQDVKDILLKKYPQFFQNNKIYSRKTNDDAQFFYVVIFELYNWEIDLINNGEWKCEYCGHTHENEYISKPYIDNKNFTNMKFCGHHCYDEYKTQFYINNELPDDNYYINDNSPIYIYKITNKHNNKCYIGKTKNAPFFRWWNHLTHSSSPFGIHLQKSKLIEWTFEVIDELDCTTDNSSVLEIESSYIKKYDSINNGYNTLISKKI